MQKNDKDSLLKADGTRHPIQRPLIASSPPFEEKNPLSPNFRTSVSLPFASSDLEKST